MTIKVEPIDNYHQHTEPTHTRMAISDRLQLQFKSEPIDEQIGDNYQLTDLDAFHRNNNETSVTQIRQHSNHQHNEIDNSTTHLREATTTSHTTSLSPSPPPSPIPERQTSPLLDTLLLSETEIEDSNDSTTSAQLIQANNDTFKLNPNNDNNYVVNNDNLQASRPLGKRSNSSHQVRDRINESRLTEQQSHQLDKLIASIVEGNDFNEFKQLVEKLSRGAKRNLLNVYVDGRTALHYSLIYGRSLKWCKQLIVNGANPNLTNRAGWHPIHLAAYNSSRETMLYLIDCLSN